MDYDDHQTLSVAFLGSLLSFTEKQLFLVINSGPPWPSLLFFSVQQLDRESANLQ
jgi:hypothetical protein